MLHRCVSVLFWKMALYLANSALQPNTSECADVQVQIKSVAQAWRARHGGPEAKDQVAAVMSRKHFGVNKAAA